ncbi:restriction endonuclease [Variovorax sp. AB1(2024)]|uniref:restriction endonuclease n=1 Tax=Variovorax sp. AB1(2024) TaxID=3132214 RepID=UPI0030978295
MSIQSISKHEFESLGIGREGPFVMPEKSWFKSTELDLAGTVFKDPFDNDWAYVLLSKEEDGVYRYHDGEHSLPSRGEAEGRLHTKALGIEATGSITEELYSETSEVPPEPEEHSAGVITSIDDEVKKYFKKHPEKLYEITPRKFEELVASILKDMGFEAELTQATRDGGRDIIAHVKTAVGSFLTYIECKRYAADNKVGVGIVREVIGVHHIRKPAKSIIVTTSFFSKDAVKEAATMESQLELKDFNDLKKWLEAY